MQNSFLFFGYVFICNVFRTESRVFCQDSNARPWSPLGHTCPVVCASVLDAIDKLIMLDYKTSVREHLGGRQKLNKRLIASGKDYNDDIRKNYYRLLRRKLSNGDINDKGIADLDENLEKTNDVHLNDPKINTDIKDKGKYNETKIEGFDDFDSNDIKSKYFENKIGDKTEHDKVEFVSSANKAKVFKGHLNIATNNKDNSVDANTIKSEDRKDKIESNEDNINKSQADHNKIDKKHLKILEDIKNVKDILRRSYTNTKIDTNTTKYDLNNNNVYKIEKCWFLEKFKRTLLIGKVVRRKCGRRSNFDAKFVSVMTNVLNKYVDTDFRFTEEMTEILLENIFGKNTDLRNNIFDVNKLLNFLRKSVDRHKIHSHKHVVTLKSKYCLTVSMPGCFCKPGFVESSGQCVKPKDCITDESYLQYITRIVVL